MSEKTLGGSSILQYQRSQGIRRIVNELGWQTISKEGFIPFKTVSTGTTFS